MTIKDIEIDESNYDKIAYLFAENIVEKERACIPHPCPVHSPEDSDFEVIQPDVLEGDFFPRSDTLMDFVKKDGEKRQVKNSILIVSVVAVTIMWGTLLTVLSYRWSKYTDGTACSFSLFALSLLFVSLLYVFACFKFVHSWQKNMAPLEEKRQTFVYKMYEQAFQLKTVKMRMWEQDREEILKTSQKKKLMKIDAEQRRSAQRQVMKEKEMVFLNAYLRHGDNIIDVAGKIHGKS